jgi:capsular polysaccharide biosynthesis protein
LKKKVSLIVKLDQSKLNKKIYISRKNYLKSHPNEKEIEKFFVDLGYESVCLEDFNTEDQIKICKNSSNIVCYLSSALINMYFVTDNTNIIVLPLNNKEYLDYNKRFYPYYEKMIKSKNVNITLIDLPYIIKEEEVDETLRKLMGV